ncbi:hypothetical protein [Pseudomonas sp. B7]|uniref:hypothetical protein n=1 Tax=Pseudomonas sp. B7 TaxID=360962 RepID=UPI00191FC713|nr:hypothetical protein [Pseudomonas sp. B7]MBL0795292.1 hypothetical protein [Pseudomonas sp. B7]
MSGSKFVINKIEEVGYHTFIHGIAPTSEPTQIEAYYLSGSGTWESLGSHLNYETQNFNMQATNTPSGGGTFPVVVCQESDGLPPNPSSSDYYLFEFTDFGKRK